MWWKQEAWNREQESTATGGEERGRAGVRRDGEKSGWLRILDCGTEKEDKEQWRGTIYRPRLHFAHRVGHRDSGTCTAFLLEVDKATSGRFQLSTDGLGAYKMSVSFIWGNRVDFAQVVKNYCNTQNAIRYSPAKIIGVEKKPQFGRPDWDHICTSPIERLNLTVRITMRRFTRLTNAHSKSHRHHVAIQAILFAW
jgi:IS1 family transposase